MRTPLRILLPITLILAACEAPTPPPSGSGSTAAETPSASTVAIDAQAIALNNRGVAQMGYFDYAGAHATFSELNALYPDWHDGSVNLAIATLNRQEEGDEAAALALVDAVLAEDPDHLRAAYVAALLRFYLGETEAALALFRQVAEADPEDGYAAYWLGQSLMQSDHLPDYVELAVAEYQRARELDPYLRSAYYGAALGMRRMGHGDAARELLQMYQRFEDNPRARLAEFKYTRMGPKAMAVSVGQEGAYTPPPRPRGEYFGPPTRLWGRAPLTEQELAAQAAFAQAHFSITTMDLEGDGVQELAVAGPIGLQLLHRGAGGWAPVQGRLAGLVGVNALAWGDLDQDGRLDLAACQEPASHLFLRRDQGWERVGPLVDGLCSDVRLFDADHDGDLDLYFTASDSWSKLINNDGDGSFRLLEQASLMDADDDRSMVASDLDGDGDLDLVVAGARGVRLHRNDRLWRYERADLPAEVRDAQLTDLVAVDVDSDGRSELVGLTTEGQVRLWFDPLADGHSRYLARDAAWDQIAVLDADGDGGYEVLASGPQGWRLMDLDGSPLAETSFAGSRRIHALVPVVLDPARGPALVAVVEDQIGIEVMAWPPGQGRYPYVALSLTGKDDQAESMRSNRSGIGTRVEAREDSRWTVADALPIHSGRGQSHEPVVIGTRGAPYLDYVALTWSDGVYQTELELAPGLHRIAETQRQLSSCPVLFAWDGSGFRFVTDLLGVGGVGFMVEPGSYAEPRPWERLLLPEGLLAEREGRYELRLGEPMQEVAYLDGARLSAIDLPPGWSVVVDERMGTGGPAPTGELIAYRREQLPQRATDRLGVEVTASVLTRDAVAAPVGELDARFIGRLAEEQVLTLEFAEALAAGGRSNGSPVLLAEGWVEYPYSQTVFAAWQAEASYDPVTLEARGADGLWRVVAERFGYPAGMPRQMVLPLPELPAGTDALRLRTNLEVYWDRLSVIHAELPPGMREHQLPLADARLAKNGYPLRTTGPQRHPDYDYSQRSPYWDTEYPEGAYTALGPVDPLLAAVDDALVTIGPGEEAQLAYAAELPALEPGWSRRFLLEVNGWAKDMDLYTRDGGTVGPLPSRSGSRSPAAEALHEQFMTRYLAGR